MSLYVFTVSKKEYSTVRANDFFYAGTDENGRRYYHKVHEKHCDHRNNKWEIVTSTKKIY